MPDLFDVCVIGGGPAGSALALRLTRMGRSVAVIEKAAFPRPHIGASLTQGIHPLLATLGVSKRIERARLLPSAGSTVFWANDFQNRGTNGAYQVDRGSFDCALLEEARDAGAVVLQPARVAASQFDRCWSLRLNTGEVLRAAFLADAAGRSAFLPGTKKAHGRRTFASYAYWHDIEPADGETLVEAAESGWYWGAPLSNRSFVACVFTDTVQPGYESLIARSRLLAPRLLGAQHGGVRVCDATAYLDDCVIGDQFIRVGDAAISIDPLSSQGVQTAIGTGMHAAAVVNTMLDRPNDADVAKEFYCERLTHSASHHFMEAGALYRTQAESTATPFWTKRAVRWTADTYKETAPLSPNQIVRIARGVSFIWMAAVHNDYVVRICGVECQGRKFAYVGGTCLADVLRLISSPITAAEVVRRWSRVTDVGAAMRLLYWSWNFGLIEAAK